MKKIAVLASGTGSNAVNITQFFGEGNRLRVDLLLFDRKDAPVAPKMRELGVETFYFPRASWRENPQGAVELLRERGIDLIVLAGFNTILPPEFVDAFPGRILNIHPSLLPQFGGEGMWGANVHEAVLKAGVQKSGATVHYVTNEVDKGEILMQHEVEVLADDTPETLEQRVHQAEYVLYPRAIVEALRRLEQPPRIKQEEKQTPEQAWAETLKIDQPVPPPIHPQNTPPAIPPANFSRPFNQPAPESLNTSQPKNEPAEPMPATYLIWSVLSTVFCCFIPGLVAIFFSSRVSSLYYSGNFEESKKASERAQLWIIISFCLGVLSATLYTPLALLFE